MYTKYIYTRVSCWALLACCKKQTSRFVFFCVVRTPCAPEKYEIQFSRQQKQYHYHHHHHHRHRMRTTNKRRLTAHTLMAIPPGCRFVAAQRRQRNDGTARRVPRKMRRIWFVIWFVISEHSSTENREYIYIYICVHIVSCSCVQMPQSYAYSHL